MSEFNYVEEAKQTLSDGFHEELVKPIDLVMVISQAVEALKEVDKLKKTLFYGKDYDPNYHHAGSIRNLQTNNRIDNVTTMLSNIDEDRKVAEDLLHGIIGAATEAGELLEALARALGGHKFDTVNLKEEVGDIFWYLAILSDNANFTFDESQRVNIEKLRKRYPNKFTEYDANNRDLDAEREILESWYHGLVLYVQLYNMINLIAGNLWNLG